MPEDFDKWVVDFVGPINPPRKWASACYIITMKDYVTRWVEEAQIKDCIAATTAKFLFDHVVTRYGCPQILVGDQGTHFVNHLIDKLTEEF